MIGIQITLIMGQSADKQVVYQFESDHDTIVLGCDLARCDVVFDSVHLQDGVGQEHLAFKRSLGAYELDLNTRYFVAVDGKPAFEGQEIQGEVQVRLGEGVSLLVELLDCRDQANISQQPLHQVGQDVKQQRQWMMLMAVAFFGFITFLIYLNRDVDAIQEEIASKTQSVKHALLDVNDKVDKVNSRQAVLAPEAIAALSRSVYLVVKKAANGSESSMGTAWAVGENQLASNAHVAEHFDRLKAGEALYVRASFAPYESIKITKTLNHPGYALYDAMWDAYKPVLWQAHQRLAYMETVHPADVALLYTASTLPSKSLTLAKGTEVNALKAGQPVAFIGYPSERLLPSTITAPTPVMQADEIIRMTDFFMVGHDDGNSRLIQHGLPVTGGASGSPIFNHQGHVIGLVSSGNVVRTLTGRLVNPADINFGQRIDFLHDLLNSKAEERTKAYKMLWQKSLAGFDREENANKQALVDYAKESFGLSEPEHVNATEYTLPKNNSGKYAKKVATQFSKPGLYIIGLSSEGYREKLKLALPADSDADQLKETIPYANLMNYQVIAVKEAVDASVEVSFSGSNNHKFRPQFKLTQFYWPVDYADFHALYAQAWLKKKLEEVEAKETKLSQLVAKELLLSPMSVSNAFVSFEQAVNQKGFYYFIITPQDSVKLNVKLRIEETGKTVKPMHAEGSVLLVVNKTDDSAETLNLLIESEKGEESNVSVKIYHGHG